MSSEAESVARLAAAVLPLETEQLTEDYYYQSLPLCLINGVFSINAIYKGVQNVIDRYCQHFHLQRIRASRNELPDTSAQQSVSELCKLYEQYGADAFAADIYRNKQRTSARGGITKSDAVWRVAGAFREHGVEHLQDVPAAMTNASLSRAVRTIPGQRSGISLGYIWMLAGSDNHIKPDRWILTFLARALGYTPSPPEAASILRDTCVLLTSRRSGLTPRLLDYMIWKRESTAGAIGSTVPYE